MARRRRQQLVEPDLRHPRRPADRRSAEPRVRRLAEGRAGPALPRQEGALHRLQPHPLGPRRRRRGVRRRQPPHRRPGTVADQHGRALAAHAGRHDRPQQRWRVRERGDGPADHRAPRHLRHGAGHLRDHRQGAQRQADRRRMVGGDGRGQARHRLFRTHDHHARRTAHQPDLPWPEPRRRRHGGAVPSRAGGVLRRLPGRRPDHYVDALDAPAVAAPSTSMRWPIGSSPTRPSRTWTSTSWPRATARGISPRPTLWKGACSSRPCARRCPKPSPRASRWRRPSVRCCCPSTRTGPTTTCCGPSTSRRPTSTSSPYR